MRPPYSPWGEIQHCEELCPGVYQVSTASHGGVMAKLSVASKLFSMAVRQYSFVEGGYLCFEEDCEAPVAIRELMDKGLYQALPVDDHQAWRGRVRWHSRVRTSRPRRPRR